MIGLKGLASDGCSARHIPYEAPGDADRMAAALRTLGAGPVRPGSGRLKPGGGRRTGAPLQLRLLATPEVNAYPRDRRREVADWITWEALSKVPEGQDTVGKERLEASVERGQLLDDAEQRPHSALRLLLRVLLPPPRPPRKGQ